MSGKHHNWHKAWSRDQAGHLQHSSGLRVLVLPGEGYTDLETDDASLVIWKASETSRGVTQQQLGERLQRLIKEAQTWHLHNP